MIDASRTGRKRAMIPRPGHQDSSMSEAVLIFGANRGTGLEVAKILAGRGDTVAAFVRPDADLAELRKLPLQQIIYGDVLDPVSVGKAFAAGRFRAVVCTVGGRRGQLPRPDYAGVKQVVDAAKTLKISVPHIVLVTVIGAGDSRGAVAPKVLEVLGEVIRLKTLAEEHLVGSGLVYTILRPGGMNDAAASGTGIRTEDHSRMGVISRAELARLVVECIDDQTARGRIYHAVDPAITWQPPLQRGEDIGRR
jgi:uncharacterized protein YbjT (DUF2867 family)